MKKPIAMSQEPTGTGFRLLPIACCLLAALVLAGCVSSQVQQKTRALNRQQLEALQKVHERQLRIQAFVEGLEPVDHADVFVRENEVRIYPYFKPGKYLSLQQRDEINEFVARTTGIGRENIKLMVKKRGKQ